MKTIKWEYITRTIGSDGISTTLEITDKLNQYGALGWELVSMVNLPIKMQFKLIVIFKRPCGFIYNYDKVEKRNPGEDSP